MNGMPIAESPKSLMLWMMQLSGQWQPKAEASKIFQNMIRNLENDMQRPVYTRIICHSLVLILLCSGISWGQESRSEVTPTKNDSLELPSFSIFSLPYSPSQEDKKNLLERDELEKFLALVEQDRSQDDFQERTFFWIIPKVFYQA